MQIIAAVNQDNGIGKNGNLLYAIAEDLHNFKELTTGKVLVMGRKTFESLPKAQPLPKRLNIILTHQKDYDAKGGVVLNSVDSLKKYLKENNIKSEDVFVIGGEKIYRLLFDYCNKFIITEVIDSSKNDADTFFPFKFQGTPLSSSEWKESKGLRYRFAVYTRKNIY